MPRLLQEDVIGNWHKLVENLQTSPREFYAAVTEALKRREIPGLKVRSIVWNEGGVIAPRREYLRMTDGRIAFDLCAAPFGTGCFFSWWLVKVRPSFVFFYALAFAACANVLKVLADFTADQMWRRIPDVANHQVPWLFERLGWLPSVLPWPWELLHWPQTPQGLIDLTIAALIVIWGVAILANLGRRGPELALQKIPVFGWVYRKMFAPITYYRLDTAIMLRAAVHAAVLEVVDGLTAAKGLRSLSEPERKPIMRELVAHEVAGVSAGG